MGKYVNLDSKYLFIIASALFIFGILVLVLDFSSYNRSMTVYGIFLILYSLLLFSEIGSGKIETKNAFFASFNFILFGILFITRASYISKGFMLFSGISLCILGVFLSYLIVSSDTTESEEEKPQLRR